MKKFILITTRDGGMITRSWIDADNIDEVSQNSIDEASQNEGVCILKDGTEFRIIAFDQTIDSLNKL